MHWRLLHQFREHTEAPCNRWHEYTRPQWRPHILQLLFFVVLLNFKELSKGIWCIRQPLHKKGYGNSTSQSTRLNGRGDKNAWTAWCHTALTSILIVKQACSTTLILRSTHYLVRLTWCAQRVFWGVGIQIDWLDTNETSRSENSPSSLPEFIGLPTLPVTPYSPQHVHVYMHIGRRYSTVAVKLYSTCMWRQNFMHLILTQSRTQGPPFTSHTQGLSTPHV